MAIKQQEMKCFPLFHSEISLLFPTFEEDQIVLAPVSVNKGRTRIKSGIPGWDGFFLFFTHPPLLLFLHTGWRRRDGEEEDEGMKRGRSCLMINLHLLSDGFDVLAHRIYNLGIWCFFKGRNGSCFRFMMIWNEINWRKKRRGRDEIWKKESWAMHFIFFHKPGIIPGFPFLPSLCITLSSLNLHDLFDQIHDFTDKIAQSLLELDRHQLFTFYLINSFWRSLLKMNGMDKTSEKWSKFDITSLAWQASPIFFCIPRTFHIQLLHTRYTNVNSSC